MIGLLVAVTLFVLIGFALFTVTRLREWNAVRVVGTASLSVAIGFLLMFPLGALFNAMNWPLFHGWALAHGSFVIAWPLLTVVGFLILRGTGVARKPTAKRT
jgi:hypothetical protein